MGKLSSIVETEILREVMAGKWDKIGATTGAELSALILDRWSCEWHLFCSETNNGWWW